MELSKFKGIASKLPIILGALVLLLVASFLFNFFSNLTNPAYGKLPNQKFKTQLTNNPKWMGSALKLPAMNKAEVFKIASRKLTPDQATTLAKRFGFTQRVKILPGENGTLFSWILTGKELYIALDSGEVSYKDNSLLINFAKNKNRTGFSKNQLIEKARNIISDYGQEDALIAFLEPAVVYQRIEPGSLETHDADTTEGAGDLISIKFQRSIKGVKILTSDNEDQIEVILTRYGDLHFLSYSNLKVESKNATYPLIGRKEAIKKVDEGKAHLSRFQDPEKETLSVAESILVNNGQLVYYNDFVTDYLQPIFVFDSFAVRGLSAAKAWVYLPAIVDSQFSK